MPSKEIGAEVKKRVALIYGGVLIWLHLLRTITEEGAGEKAGPRPRSCDADIKVWLLGNALLG